MNFEQFNELYQQAKTAIGDELVLYQEIYLEEFEPADNVGIDSSDVLFKILSLANASLLHNIIDDGFNMTEFSKSYDIPYRSIQNWCRGEREAPGYVKELIDYTLFIKWLNNHNKKQ